MRWLRAGAATVYARGGKRFFYGPLNGWCRDKCGGYTGRGHARAIVDARAATVERGDALFVWLAAAYMYRMIQRCLGGGNGWGTEGDPQRLRCLLNTRNGVVDLSVVGNIDGSDFIGCLLLLTARHSYPFRRSSVVIVARVCLGEGTSDAAQRSRRGRRARAGRRRSGGGRCGR